MGQCAMVVGLCGRVDVGGVRSLPGVVDSSADRPMYKQVADLLRAAIVSGELAAGAQLPSEQELIDEYGVGRSTARQAVTLLRNEGLIEVVHGRGSFVRGREPVRRLGQERLAREQWEREHPHEPTLKIELLEFGKTSAPADVAERLGIADGSDVLVRRRRYMASFMPLELAASYIPWSIARGTLLTDADASRGSVYARLEEAGHRLARFSEEVEARIPTEAEARALKLRPGAPVMDVLRVAYTQDDRPVEVSRQVMSAERHRLVYEYRPE
jgi:GntR family transcriptional regulator